MLNKPSKQVIKLVVGLLTLLSATWGATPAATAQQDFEIDNSHTSVIFAISHFKISYVYGRFNRCSGQVVLDRFNPSLSEFKLTIDTQSVDTNNAERDASLRGAAFLDTTQHPAIQFVSESVTETEGTYLAKGKLTIKGVAREITIPFKLLGAGDGPLGNSRIGMISKFTVKRSDYGINEMLDRIGDDVAITFSFQAVEK